ncbi:hypothetical protein ACP275_11G074700 [Erythranthe tilingii]
MYVITYVYYAPYNYRVRAIISFSIVVGFLGATILVTFVTILGYYRRITVVGRIGNFFWLVASVGPLGHLREIIQTRNLNLVPLTLTCLMTLHGFVWTMDIVLSRDGTFFIPSLLVCVLGVLEIGVYSALRLAPVPGPHHDIDQARTQAQARARVRTRTRAQARTQARDQA